MLAEEHSMTYPTPLRAIRKRLGQTMTEVSVSTGIDQGNLSRIERGSQPASKETAEKLARHFAGYLNEIHILYPERFFVEEDGTLSERAEKAA